MRYATPAETRHATQKRQVPKWARARGAAFARPGAKPIVPPAVHRAPIVPLEPVAVAVERLAPVTPIMSARKAAGLTLGMVVTLSGAIAAAKDAGIDDAEISVAGSKTYQGVWSIPTGIPVADSKPLRYGGGCVKHDRHILAATLASARVYRDTVEHWCPKCTGWES